MRARQRLMPRKESVLDKGRETQPLSSGGALTGANAQTARLTGHDLETQLRSRGTHTIIPRSITGIWDLLKE